MLCCLVALVLVAAMFVNTAVLKVKVFVTNRPIVAGVAGVVVLLATAAVPYVLLSSQ